MKIVIRGTVQGVGFRPAVYRTAVSLGLRGTVCNNGSNVTIEVDDGDAFLEAFLRDLPPLARIESVEKTPSDIDPSIKGFSIIESDAGDMEGSSIPADTAVCSRCLEDMRSGRRKGYPFTTCTDCGPRRQEIPPPDGVLPSVRSRIPSSGQGRTGDPMRRPDRVFRRAPPQGRYRDSQELGRDAHLLHTVPYGTSPRMVPPPEQTIRRHGPRHRIGEEILRTDS